MSQAHATNCPECEDRLEFDYIPRRDFLRRAAAAFGALAVGPAVLQGADEPKAEPSKSERPANKPAEELIKELHGNLSEQQKKDLVLPWDHGGARPTRLGMYNAALLGKTIERNYTKPQQELVERILKSISSGDEGYKKLSRNGNFDTRGGFQGCGALIFGEPVDSKKFSWVFSGHHLTVRCDGNSEEGAAFGGPMYYGHSPNGYSPNNVFHFQTKSVLSVHEMLSEEQRKKAVVRGTPGEQASSVRFRKEEDARPGITTGELSADQKKLVETVMRDLLSPYRKEDADEVMEIVKKNGGMDKIHLAFYRDNSMADNNQWHFWRLEGPGFVWNYRVLPHVHTFVNISSKLG